MQFEILSHGVMVTLQILVLSLKVRVLLGQQQKTRRKAGFLLLSVTIHIFVIFLIISACDIVHPFLIVEIPFDGFFNALFKLE